MADIDDIEQPRATGLIPNEPDLEGLREAAAECTACPLYRNATQTVFGEGPDRAVIMFVGEQPGDYEDLAGHPFVGPAGKMLDRCIKEAPPLAPVGSTQLAACWVTQAGKDLDEVAG